MQQAVQECVECLLGGGNLTAAEAALAAGAIMDGECEPVDIAAFLTALAMRPLMADELCGAATAMRQRAAVIPTSRSPLLDTCGTGGDRLHTFNISTAAAPLRFGVVWHSRQSSIFWDRSQIQLAPAIS